MAANPRMNYARGDVELQSGPYLDKGNNQTAENLAAFIKVKATKRKRLLNRNLLTIRAEIREINLLVKTLESIVEEKMKKTEGLRKRIDDEERDIVAREEQNLAEEEKIKKLNKSLTEIAKPRKEEQQKKNEAMKQITPKLLKKVYQFLEGQRDEAVT